MYDEDTLAYLRHEMKSAIIQGDMQSAQTWLTKVTAVEAELVFDGVDLLPIHRKEWGLDTDE